VQADRGVAQIEIQIVDENSVPVYFSDNEIICTNEGPVKLLALGASNPQDMGDYTNNSLRVYHGRMLAMQSRPILTRLNTGENEFL